MRLTQAHVRAAVRQARELLNVPKNRPCELEAGLRLSAAEPAVLTLDSRLWSENGDLEELAELHGLEVHEGERLDLYVRGWDPTWEEPALVGNLDGTVQPDGSLLLSEQLPEPWGGPEENPKVE
jgi:hypothetical protein